MEINYQLIYDVATMSEAPKQALALGGLIGGVAAVMSIVQWFQGNSPGGLTRFFVLAAVILVAVGIGLEYEKRWIVRKAEKEARVVQGTVIGYWAQRERQRPGSTSYWEWEGFTVGGTQFAYRRNASQNYFHNPGPGQLQIRDGMQVRVQYLDASAEGRSYGDITRLEIANVGLPAQHFVQP